VAHGGPQRKPTAQRWGARSLARKIVAYKQNTRIAKSKKIHRPSEIRLWRPKKEKLHTLLLGSFQIRRRLGAFNRARGVKRSWGRLTSSPCTEKKNAPDSGRHPQRDGRTVKLLPTTEKDPNSSPVRNTSVNLTRNLTFRVGRFPRTGKRKKKRKIENWGGIGVQGPACQYSKAKDRRRKTKGD